MNQSQMVSDQVLFGRRCHETRSRRDGVRSTSATRMNLLERRGLAQLRRRVAEHSLVGGAVVQAPSLDVDQGNHVGCVFGDRLEDLVFLAEFAVGLEDPQLLDDHQDD